MEGFYRKEGGKGSYSQKEKKKKVALDQGNEGREKQRLSFLPLGDGEDSRGSSLY